MSVAVLVLAWILCGVAAIKIVSRFEDEVSDLEAGMLIFLGPVVVFISAVVFAVWFLGKCARFIARV